MPNTKQPRKPFPKRENTLEEHKPDLDGKTSYGRDQETTYKDKD